MIHTIIYQSTPVVQRLLQGILQLPDLTTENTSGCIFDIDTRKLTAKDAITVEYRGGLDLKEGTLNIAGTTAQRNSDGTTSSITNEQVDLNDENSKQYSYGNNDQTWSVMRIGKRTDLLR